MLRPLRRMGTWWRRSAGRVCASPRNVVNSSYVPYINMVILPGLSSSFLVDRFEKFTTEMCPSTEHNWLSAGEWLATLPRLQSRTHVLLLNLSSIEADILTVSE